jgi:membrane fusion protein (multidrug efflux system)
MVFPNPDTTLLPGMFVRAIVEEGVNEQAILAPQQGVTRNRRGDAVALVVDNEGKVAQRALEVDRAIGDRWLVTKGLAAGDQVIVDNLQKIRPGDPVKAVPFAPQAGPQGAAAEAPPAAAGK